MKHIWVMTVAVLGVMVFIGLVGEVEAGALADQTKAEVQASGDGAARILADFNAPAPNNVEGIFGAFYPENEQVYICQETLDDITKHGQAGSSMRLVYNVEKGGSYNGFWMKLGPADSGNNFDATGFNKLTFWVKGDGSAGIPNKFKVELKGDPGTTIGKKYVGELSEDWKKVEIDLQEYANQKVDLTRLNEFVVVFENRAVAPATKGAIFIDDVQLEK